LVTIELLYRCALSRFLPTSTMRVRGDLNLLHHLHKHWPPHSSNALLRRVTMDCISESEQVEVRPAHPSHGRFNRARASAINFRSTRSGSICTFRNRGCTTDVRVPDDRVHRVLDIAESLFPNTSFAVPRSLLLYLSDFSRMHLVRHTAAVMVSSRIYAFAIRTPEC
jgi:hypothetical protein